jgi:hypothetical protein
MNEAIVARVIEISRERMKKNEAGRQLMTAER